MFSGTNDCLLSLENRRFETDGERRLKLEIIYTQIADGMIVSNFQMRQDFNTLELAMWFGRRKLQGKIYRSDDP